jgi:anti-sigma B factor antagonist
VEIPAETAGSVVVLTPRVGALDASNSRLFSRQVTRQVAPGGKVAIDMSRVTLVDSFGFGAIITCLRHLRPGGGDLKLFALTKPVRIVSEVIRLHKLVDILNTRDEALRAFGA